MKRCAARTMTYSAARRAAVPCSATPDSRHGGGHRRRLPTARRVEGT